jgi:hypothetical protein
MGRPKTLDFNRGSYITFAADSRQTVQQQPGVDGLASVYDKRYAFRHPAGLAVHERQAEMCIDRHLVSRAVGIALASAHPAV